MVALAIQLSTAEPPKPTLSPPAATAPLTAMVGDLGVQSRRHVVGPGEGRLTTMSPAADSADPTAPA